MFVWNIHDAILVGLLCIAGLLLVLAWLIYWFSRLIAWIKKLGRRASSAWAMFARRCDFVLGN